MPPHKPGPHPRPHCLQPSPDDKQQILWLTAVPHAGRWTYDVMVMGNGALAGLVAITAGCSTIYPWGAILVGGFSGVLYNMASIISLKLHVSAVPLQIGLGLTACSCKAETECMHLQNQPVAPQSCCRALPDMRVDTACIPCQACRPGLQGCSSPVCSASV